MTTPTSFDGPRAQINLLDNGGCIASSTAVVNKSVTILDDGASSSVISNVYSRAGTTTREAMTQSLNAAVDDGQELSIDLYSEPQNTMQHVASVSPKQARWRSVNGTKENTVSFDVDGLHWDNADSSLYLGGNVFRLRVAKDSLNKDTLSIEAMNEQGDGYDVKFQVSRT